MLAVVDALPTVSTSSLKLPEGYKWTDVDEQLENVVLSTSTNESLLETLALRYIIRRFALRQMHPIVTLVKVDTPHSAIFPDSINGSIKSNTDYLTHIFQ